MINQLQSEAQRAVNAAESSKTRAAEGVTAAQRTSEALDAIAVDISGISDLNTQVATATEEQSSVAAEINTHVTAISDSTERNAETAQELLQASDSLRDLASRLQELVGRFRY